MREGMRDSLRYNNIILVQAFSARNPEDGQRGGSESADLVLAGATESRVSEHRELQGEHEHGDSSHAVSIEDPRHSCPTLGQCYSERYSKHN